MNAPRDPEVTSRIMSAVRSTGTRPEMLLRRALFIRGMRYRVRTAVTGKPDVVFPTARVACFVDGAFWHGGGWRERGYSSLEAQFAGRPRGEWWTAKIKRNVARDQEVTHRLQAEGWKVLRYWDFEVKANPDRIAGSIQEVVRTRTAAARRG